MLNYKQGIPGSLDEYHTKSESLQIIICPRFRDQHLKPPWSAILDSSASDMRNKKPVSEEKIESPHMLW